MLSLAAALALNFLTKILEGSALQVELSRQIANSLEEACAKWLNDNIVEELRERAELEGCNVLSAIALSVALTRAHLFVFIVLLHARFHVEVELAGLQSAYQALAQLAHGLHLSLLPDGEVGR